MSTDSPGAGLAPADRAAVLAIGDEVLRGEVVNGNAAFLGDRLFDLGLDVVEHAVVADRPEEIAAALRRLARAAATVVVTGGLGPTEDDRTVDTVAALLGVARTSHAPSEARLRDWFAARGQPLTPNNLRQAEIPMGAQPLPNPVGLAPGFAVTLDGARCFFLPGVPREMRRVFGDHVVPEVRAHLRSAGIGRQWTRTFHVHGMGESQVDHRLAGLLEGCPPGAVSVHFRTAAPENHVRLVLRDGAALRATGTSAEELLERLSAELRRRLGAAVYGSDGETFVGVLRRAYVAAGLRLAFAESCTGGLCGQLVTHEPGASAFFAGSVVAYENAVKERLLAVPAEVLRAHGAVSEACARAMALGARAALMVDVAVAVTGIAGDLLDDLGDPDARDAVSGKPVGTVCFAVAGTTGVRAETRRFAGDRARVRRAAAHHALELARGAIADPAVVETRTKE